MHQEPHSGDLCAAGVCDHDGTRQAHRHPHLKKGIRTTCKPFLCQKGPLKWKMTCSHFFLWLCAKTYLQLCQIFKFLALLEYLRICFGYELQIYIWYIIDYQNLFTLFCCVFQSNRTCPICRGDASGYFSSSE